MISIFDQFSSCFCSINIGHSMTVMRLGAEIVHKKGIVQTSDCKNVDWFKSYDIFHITF